MKHFKSIFLTITFLFTFNAHAILHVEPHLGLTLLGIGQNSVNPATMIKHNGAQYGMKIGATYLNAMAGLDYNRSSFEQLTNGYVNDFSRNELGLVFGYNFPGIARTWITYFFKNTQTANTTSALLPSGSEYSGHTVELGAGYNGFNPFLSVNILYRIITQTKLTKSSGTTEYTGSTEIGSSEVVLSVSAPMNFF